MQNHPYGRLPYGQQAMNMYTQNQPLPPGELYSFSHHHLIIVMVVSKMLPHWFRRLQEPFWILFSLLFYKGGPGLEPPYRPARNPQMNKMMPVRPNYTGMMSGMQGNMPGMMGLDKQYSVGFKPQPNMPQGQMLRQQLQVRLVSQSGSKNHLFQSCGRKE